MATQSSQSRAAAAAQTATPQKSSGGLEVGPAGDRFEYEAERVSRLVTRGPGTDAGDGQGIGATTYEFDGVRYVGGRTEYR